MPYTDWSEQHRNVLLNPSFEIDDGIPYDTYLSADWSRQGAFSLYNPGPGGYGHGPYGRSTYGHGPENGGA